MCDDVLRESEAVRPDGVGFEGGVPELAALSGSIVSLLKPSGKTPPHPLTEENVPLQALWVLFWDGAGGRRASLEGRSKVRIWAERP